MFCFFSDIVFALESKRSGRYGRQLSGEWLSEVSFQSPLGLCTRKIAMVEKLDGTTISKPLIANYTQAKALAGIPKFQQKVWKTREIIIIYHSILIGKTK